MQKLRLMVVDCDNDNCEKAKMFLNQEDMEVVAIANYKIRQFNYSFNNIRHNYT